MPNSAISTGLVDKILLPEEMPSKLIAITKYLKERKNRKTSCTISNENLGKVFSLLRDKTNHDFSSYKVNTIGRRIERRMLANHLDFIDDYITFLENC